MAGEQTVDFTSTLVDIVISVEAALRRGNYKERERFRIGDALYCDDTFRDEMLALFQEWGQRAK